MLFFGASDIYFNSSERPPESVLSNWQRPIIGRWSKAGRVVRGVVRCGAGRVTTGSSRRGIREMELEQTMMMMGTAPFLTVPTVAPRGHRCELIRGPDQQLDHALPLKGPPTI